MKIFLIGLPGSGKTTIGRALAERLAIPFVDLDVEVEKKEGCSIGQIFEREGEPYFRQAEASVLREISTTHDSFVMATGGGTPCFYEGIEFMNGHGVTVFLDVPLDMLLKRLSKSGVAERPLFQKGLNIGEALQQLQLARQKFYNLATHRITAPNLPKLIELIKV